MKIDSFEEVSFFVACLMLLSSVESFNWTVQPFNPTPVTKGEELSLTWEYSLTADEQTKSQTFYGITWKKLNQSTLNYDKIGAKAFTQFFGTVTYSEPFAPHIVIDRNKQATLLIKTIEREDEGTYAIEYSLDGTGITITGRHEVNVTVQESPEIVNVSSDQDVCEHSDVTLSCNATGKPEPNITWTRVRENGPDSGELKSEDGYYVLHNVSRSSSGTYRCTAFNGVGECVNQTTTVLVRYSPSVDIVVSSPNTAIEGHPYNLTCNVSGDPLPHISWIKVSNDKCTVGRLLQFDNISRNDAGDYRCVASNRCGNDSKTETINVLYKPAYVTLETNATENKDCSDLWVNFNCTSSKANPPVYNYLLLKNGTEFKSSKSGTWIEKIAEGGKPMYSCIANQSVESVLSDIITLTVNVPTSVRKAKKAPVNEGYNLQESCLNITGFPYPTVIWEMNGKHIADGNLLNFTKISRDKAGDYRCTANNTCGTNSTMVYIDVKYKPENIVLRSNSSSNEVCAGAFVNLTCTADANPPVHTYLLYENGEVIDSLNKTGTWLRRLNTGGNFTYKCKVNNSVLGIEESRSLAITLNVPPSIKQVQNESVEEGDTLKVYCNATGSPYPMVLWTKNDINISNESVLIFSNISRDKAGEYRCTANNTCGTASTMVYIDVEYSPSITNITGNLTMDEREVAKLYCKADGNPTPSYTWRNVSFMTIGRGSSTTVQISGKESEGYYTCIADNGIGNSTSAKVHIFVECYSPTKTVLTTDAVNKTVNISQPFILNCSAEANPDAMYKIYNDTDILVVNDSITTTAVEERVMRVTFRCEPNNSFGVGPTAKITLEVHFPPYVYGDVTVVKYEDNTASLPCPLRGNPPPSFKWFRGNNSEPFLSGSSSLDFLRVTKDDNGSYVCLATNHLGTTPASVNLIVNPINKTIPITMTIRGERNESEMNKTCKLCSTLACNNSEHCVGKETTACEPGSIIVYFLLQFSKSVDTNKVLSDLKKAAMENRFDGCDVDPNSIRQVSSSTSTTEPTTTESTTTEELTPTKRIPLEAIVIPSATVVVFLAGGAIIYHVHKKRKCRKNTRVDDADGQPISSKHSTLSCGNPYAEINSGYAKSGPLPAVDNEQEQGAVGGEAVPTYATVDKSEKKDESKDKKAAEQGPTEDQYAVVDKSKKKKKKKKKRNEPGATYAEVDMSKKSKKKEKPGEVLYADLDEFHQMKKMPEVSTSPKPLQPIKRPDAYVETQYADITQFLKGNLEVTGAEPPQYSTTSAVSNTATGSREKSSAGNTGDGSEATKETGF